MPGDVDDSDDQGQLPGYSRAAAYKQLGATGAHARIR